MDNSTYNAVALNLNFRCIYSVLRSIEVVKHGSMSFVSRCFVNRVFSGHYSNDMSYAVPSEQDFF